MESQRIEGLNYNSAKLLMLITLLGLVVTACASSLTRTNGQGGVPDHSGSSNVDPRTGVEYPNMMFMPGTERVKADWQQLNRFLTNNPQMFDGCEVPSGSTPLIFSAPPVESISEAGYVVEGKNIVYLSTVHDLRLYQVVHEIFHANCNPKGADSEMLGWSESQRLFHTTDESYFKKPLQIEIISQKGNILFVEVDGKEKVLRGMEEMAASLFMRRELVFTDPAYSPPIPKEYGDLFKMTRDYITFIYGTEIVSLEEMLTAMESGVLKGRGKNDSYTIIFQEIENLVISKGRIIPDNFRSDFIQYLYLWESQSNNTSSIEGIKVKSTLKTKWVTELIKDLYDTGVEGDQLALQYIGSILDASTKVERNRNARKARKYLFTRRGNGKVRVLDDPSTELFSVKVV